MMETRRKFLVGCKFFSIILILMLLSLSASAVIEHMVYNDEITVKYSFGIPRVTKSLIGNDIVYDTISMPGVSNAGNPGEPYLPVKGAYILLPENTEVDKINVTPGRMVSLGLGFNIEPVGKPVPLSIADAAQLPEPDARIYRSNCQFPGKLFTEVGTYSFRGYNILVLDLYPVQFTPSTGELLYYPDLTISVSTVKNDKTNTLFRGLEKDKSEVIKKVDNYDAISTYIGKSIDTVGDSYDLLIITTNSLKEGFEPLKAVHDAEGIRTIIKTLSEIGCSTPEDIRSYIRDAYTNLGIEYVLIGGDTDVVPAKMLWVSGMDEDTDYHETDMPSDLYYACLDGTYNYDGDNKWGEPTDGNNGGDVDLVAEVYVGRACVGNNAEVEHFVNKTISYIMSNNRDYLKNFLLAGENLGDYGVASWGGNYLDQLIDGSTDDNYTTVGIPSDKYNINMLYDRDGIWSKTELIDFINDGVHVINHLGHSDYNYDLKINNEDVVDDLTNDKYCFIYSQGCMAGGFDNGDCIAEYFTVKTEHGAFAGIWNARYGYFWSYSTDGDSQRFNREFWDAVFNEDTTVISIANQDSKEDNLYLINRSCIRWVYYELNLFGDPAVALFYDRPCRPMEPSGPTSGKAKIGYTYTTSTTDPNDDQVYYKWNWGNGNFSDWVGPYDSGEKISTSYTWNHKGSYEVSVKAKDVHGEESLWSEPLPVSISKHGRSYRSLFFQFIQQFQLLNRIDKMPFSILTVPITLILIHRNLQIDGWN